jgi:hypothetical protein
MYQNSGGKDLCFFLVGVPALFPFVDPSGDPPCPLLAEGMAPALNVSLICNCNGDALEGE